MWLTYPPPDFWVIPPSPIFYGRLPWPLCFYFVYFTSPLPHSKNFGGFFSRSPPHLHLSNEDVYFRPPPDFLPSTTPPFPYIFFTSPLAYHTAFFGGVTFPSLLRLSSTSAGLRQLPPPPPFAACRNYRIKRLILCRCMTGTLKKPAKWRWEPDRRYNNFFFSPLAHLCRHIYDLNIVAWDVKHQ